MSPTRPDFAREVRTSPDEGSLAKRTFSGWGDKAATAVKRVAGALATPRKTDDYLDMFDPLRAGADLRGRIIDITPETADAATITIEPGRDWAGHTPGQYIRIGVDIEGVRNWRTYSLTHDAQRTDGCITITTKAIPDGLVSNHLVRGGARPGTLIHLDQATGDFTLPDTAPGKVLFITAGSGITPVIGMLRNRRDLADVVHIHCAPTPAASMFAGELAAYHGNGRLQLIARHDDEHGILDLARELDTLVPDWRERQAWVCGPTGLLNAAEAHWQSHGTSEHLHVERFRPVIIEGGEGGQITFLASHITVDADGMTPILDAGEAAGALMPSGCRMGICFGCVVPLRQGAVRDLRTGEITTAEPGDNVTIQTCINAAAGCCEIQL